MQKLFVLTAMAVLFSCSKPGNPEPGSDPDNPGSSLTITSISPAAGDPNTILVIITGTGFNSTPANNEVLLADDRSTPTY